MGFQAPAYKLVWPDGSQWSGLEVRLRGMNIGELEEISKLRSEVTAEGRSVTDLEQVMPILDILGGALLSWNLEAEEDHPIPISAFREQDAAMLLAIVSAWTEVVGKIPPVSSPTSPDGKRSEEALIPMEIPSSSQLSSSTQN
jgi:hypothetical protein